MLCVRMCMPAMMSMKPATFVRAKRAEGQSGALLLSEDRPDVAEPKPSVKGYLWKHDMVYSPYHPTVADMQNAIFTLVAEEAKRAPPETMFSVPAMESTAKHATTDTRRDMFAYDLHIFDKACCVGVALAGAPPIVANNERT